MTTSINQKYLKRAFFDKVERANSYAYKSQVFVGEPSDFIVIIKDSIHKNDGKQPTPTAGKYICYGKGQYLMILSRMELSTKKGLSFIFSLYTKKSNTLVINVIIKRCHSQILRHIFSLYMNKSNILSMTDLAVCRVTSSAPSLW